MKDYIDDIVVWAIIGGIVATLYFALFRKQKTFIFLLGMLIVIGAVPAGFMLELSANGCCGAPASPYKGIGFVLIAIMVVLGAILVAVSTKKKRDTKPS